MESGEGLRNQLAPARRRSAAPKKIADLLITLVYFRPFGAKKTASAQVPEAEETRQSGSGWAQKLFLNALNSLYKSICFKALKIHRDVLLRPNEANFSVRPNRFLVDF